MSNEPPTAPVVPPIGVMTGVGVTITDIDDGLLAILGYSRAEFEANGLSWLALTPPEHVHLDQAAIHQAYDSKTAFTAPYAKEFVRKDGARVPVLIAFALIPGAAGKWLTYVVSLATPSAQHATPGDAAVALDAPLDAHLYGRLVGTLVLDRARMMTMLDTTDALMWAVDPAGYLLAANTAFQDVQRQLSGRTMEMGAHLLGPAYPAEHLAVWRGLYARALAGERFIHQTSGPLAGVREHRLSPIRDAGERVVGVAVISQDVSARVAAEQALRESENRFRSLAASAPIGIYLTDADARPIYVNPRLAAMWGSDRFAPDEWLRCVHPDDVTRAAAASRRGRAAGAEFEMEFRMVRPETGERHLRVHVAPVRDQDRIIGWVGSVEDDTERRAREAHAGQRAKMESLGTLAGGIAHDFNNMLGVILGSVEVALGDLAAPDLATTLREIQTAGARARDLVRQILTFSRRDERTDIVLDLVALTAEGARLLRATLAVPIAVSLPAVPVLVRGDPSALQQIVVNLCTNAAYAMREAEGQIAIRLERIEDEAVLTVVDVGEGIPPEVAPRMFEPFFTTKPVGVGTGMGLAVVHGVVTSHGGSITVDSTPGAGATFRVALPVARGALEVAAPLEAPDALHAGRILVVEDEPALARLTGRRLAHAGYTVTLAANGIEGLQLFSADPERFDLVLTDLTMPGLAGNKLAHAMRVVRPDLPIILTSGFVGGLDPDPAANHVTAILTKPVSIPELLATIRAALVPAR